MLNGRQTDFLTTGIEFASLKRKFSDRRRYRLLNRKDETKTRHICMNKMCVSARRTYCRPTGKVMRLRSAPIHSPFPRPLENIKFSPGPLYTNDHRILQ